MGKSRHQALWLKSYRFEFFTQIATQLGVALQQAEYLEQVQYAPDCMIVAPENLRSLIKEKLKTLCQHYDLEVDS